MSMRPLELFHLKYLSKKCGTDIEEIDSTLTYHENKRHLLEIARNKEVRLEVWEEEMSQFAFAYEDRQIDHLISNIQAIAYSERRTTKVCKWLVGRLILQMHDVIWSRYGDHFFGKLAKQIGCKGYSSDQLRKCVHFAELREELAISLIENNSVTWEEIRRERLREIEFISPFEGLMWMGCPEVLQHLNAIQQIFLSKGKQCKDCRYYKLCSRLIKQMAELSQSLLR